MKRRFRDDIMDVYLLLQDMHDTIMRGELFKQELIDRSRDVTSNLADWKIEDTEERVKVLRFITTIVDLLNFNDKMKAKREELIKGYMTNAIQTEAK